MRTIVKIIAAFSVIWSGCNAAKVSSKQEIPQPQAAITHQQPSAEQGQVFQDVVSGKAETVDGTPFSFHSYKSSDGVPVSTRFERRDSPARAKKELLRNIKAAVEVLEREPKLDESGRQIGERAVLTAKQEGSAKLQTTVIWNDGSQLYFVESPSLQHALEFEKWYLRNP